MKFRVIDFETTGKIEDKAAGKPVGVVEVGWTDVSETGHVFKPQSRLVNPHLPIPPEARGVHHISEAMLEDALRVDEAFKLLMTDMQPRDYFVAHHAAYERAFFGGGGLPWVCTMVCAKHLWEDAPDYKNQTLRYWLDVDQFFEWPELAMPPHRAGPDSYVTAHILSRMLLMKEPASLVTLTNTIVLQKRVMFSKHKGQLWSEMDRGFLEWVLDPAKDFDPEVKATARHWLNRGLGGTPFA
ncbi:MULTISPECIES: hypothetical protein [Agrobacterium]|nr:MULTISPECIES: hypothetical protein [Agrobacterium]MDA5627841.1 hypothetical protein [Agrobacterium sp. ST15.16.055]MDA6978413.1 hypothetical protein [Agrobacterium salinitolerans]